MVAEAWPRRCWISTRLAPAARALEAAESRRSEGTGAGVIFAEHFITTSEIRPSTQARYETHAHLYILPAFGSRELRSVTKADVQAFLADLRARGKGTATVEAVYRLLHRLFQVAADEERISRNPATGVRVAASHRREPRFLTEEEVRRIAAETREPYRTLIYFLAYTGLRIGEATALRMANLDLATRTVRVVENAPEVRGQKVTGPTKTGRARTVHIGVGLKEMLQAHVRASGRAFDPDALVFAGPNGGAIRQNAFRRRIFQRAAERAQVTPMPTVHDLRHTAANLMAKAGFSMHEAAEQLGHSYTAMTARHSHVFPSDRERKVDALDRIMTAST